jgi:acetyl esterase/lipase
MMAPEGIDESASGVGDGGGGGDASDDDEPTIDRSAEEDEERAIQLVREENRLPVLADPSEAPLATAAATADASALESPLSSSFSLLSPVHGDLRELPPAHVVYGALEAIGPDIASFTSRLRDAGVVVSEEISSRLTHNYVLLDPLFGSEAAAAWRRCGEFVAEQLLQRAREHSDHKEALARNVFSTAAFIDAHP